MKKKTLKVILSLCIAMAMTACGRNTGTAEVEETAIAEEDTEADVQGEAEAEEETMTPEETEEQARLEEADAYYESGRKSLYGLDGTAIDSAEAYTSFLKAQELGNTNANFYLGILTDDYSYPKSDYEQAKAYYEQSGDNSYAQVALGCLYYYGNGVEQDTEKAKALFQSAADQDAVEGYYGLAIAAGGEEDFETALEYFNRVLEESTEQFYIMKAMVNLGNMYQYGNGVEQDGAKAIEWYTKAADLGNVSAMNWLGYIYTGDSGIERDVAKAIEWYTKAADLGDTNAMVWLANIYLDGSGAELEQDSAKAIEWYTKAADLGNAHAMGGLGTMYRWGLGVEQDSAKAIEWYTKAADLGDVLSQIDLDEMKQEMAAE